MFAAGRAERRALHCREGMRPDPGAHQRDGGRKRQHDGVDRHRVEAADVARRQLHQHRWLRRHRHFESPLELREPQVGCYCDQLPIGGVYGNGGGGVQTRGVKFTSEQGRQAMEIDWMTRRELSQAIPPAYTTFIGFQLKRLLG